MEFMVWQGQGPVTTGDPESVTNKIIHQRSIGCSVSLLSLKLERKMSEIFESCSGNLGLLMEWAQTKGGVVTLELNQFSTEEYAAAMAATSTAIVAGTVTAEALPTMADGDLYHLVHTDISSLVLTDSAATPETVLADDFTVEDAKTGRIKLVSVLGYTQPFKAAYSYGGATLLKPLAAESIIKSLIFDGISVADKSRQRVILPRVSWQPGEIQLLGDKLATLKLTGKLMIADVASNDPVLGPFGSINIMQPV
jgi:hypothetical protein